MKPSVFITLGLLASMAVIAVIVVLVPSTEDFDPYNPLWNGLSGFTRSYNVTLTPTAMASSLSSGAVLVVGASVDFTRSEVEALKGFVERGGYLIVLEDFKSAGYTLLESLGLKVEVYSGVLVDPVFYYKDYTLPRVTIWNVTGYFNYGTAIKGHDGVCVGYSSTFSFVDLNFNGAFDNGEPRGPLCVAVEWRLGRGAVLLVADSSLPINSMLDVNRELLERLTLTDAYVVSDKWSKGLYSTMRSQAVSLYNVVMGTQLRYVLAVALLALYPVVSRAWGALREEDVGGRGEDVRRILMQHPNWDPEIVRVIAEDLRRRDSFRRSS